MPQSVIIKPNLRKNFTIDLVVVVFLAAVFLGIFFMLNYFVGIGTYLLIFEYIGLGINEEAIITIILISVAIVSFVVLIYDYLVLSNIKYEFFPNHMIYRKNISLVFNQETRISYENLSRISYEEGGFFNKSFSTGTIIIDISGLKMKEIKLEAIDNVEQTARLIHNTIREFNFRKSSQFQRQERLGEILEEERY